MSRVILEDTGTPALWVISGGGDVIWKGTVTNFADLELVGPVDTVTADGSTIYYGAAVTGLHYKAGTVTTFPAYDGVETFTAAATVVIYFLLLWWIVRVVGKMLANKEPSL